MASTSPTPTMTPVDPVDLADDFFAVTHALKRNINARVQPTGLSLARLQVLFQLVDGQGIRIGELSSCIGVAARTMTSTIEAMERDALVTRHPDRFRAVVMHSGIPPGTAHSTLSALRAMHGHRGNDGV